MFLNKKQFLLLSFGIACSACMQAAPKEETDEFAKIATPAAIQFGLSYITATELDDLSCSYSHKALESLASVVVWNYLKNKFSAKTGLTENSLPCDPAAHKGYIARSAATAVNWMTGWAYTGLDLVGPMILRELIAGDVKAHAKRQ